MTTIVTRQTGPYAKGSPLTNTELDNNFINLNDFKVDTSGGTITGDLTIDAQANVHQRLAVGTGAYTVLPNLISQFTGTSSIYSQVNQQNLNPYGTGDFVVTASNGTDLTNYIDMGMSGFTYANTNYNSWSFVWPNDGFLMVQGNPAQDQGGNLFIGTAGSGSVAEIGDIVFIQGSDTHEVGRWVLGQGLVISTNTPSVSNSTGSLVVTGGVGVKGNVWADAVHVDGIDLKEYTESTNTYLQSIKVSKSGDSMTGALVISNTGGKGLEVTGNVIFHNDMYVSGNLVIGGNTTQVSANSLTIDDPIIYLANNSVGNSVDMGFVGHFTSDHYQHTGLVRDHIDGKWKFFSNVTPEPTTTVDFSTAVYDTLKVGTIEASTANIANVNLLEFANLAFTKANTAYDTAVSKGIVNTVSGTTSRITSTGSTDITIDLATVPSVTAGTYTYPQLQVDAYGRIVTISNQTPVTSVTNTSPINVSTTGGAVTVSLASSGATVGTYGGTTNVATITVDTYGRITSVSNTAIITGATISDDTATNSGYYPLFTTVNSGTLTTVKVSSSKLTYNPSSGLLTSTAFSGSGASLTNLPAGNLSGTIPSAVLGNSTHYVGTTAIALNRSSANQGLTGISSIAMPGSSSGTLTLQPTSTAGTTTITLPATTGTVITTGDTGTVTSTMIADGTIVNGDISAAASIAVSKLAASTISGVTLGGNLSAVTFNNAGSGAVSGSTYNGSAILTVSYNTVGASPLAGSSSLTTTGTVTSGTWSGSFGAVSGANLTNLTAGNLSGTIPSAVLGNSTQYVGTTAIALNRSSAAQALTGITSIDGYAADVGGGASNQILYQTASNSTDYITAPTTANTVLTWTGSGFSWNVASSGGASGATLSAADGTSTYYIGLSANTSGNWTDARVDASNLYYNSASDTLYATNYNTASDRNLKDNIATLNNSLEVVNKMNAVEFDWKNTGKKSYGVIAQELEQILPELVDDTEGRKTVNYNALIGFLIGSVKELSEKVEKLEKK
jgi:hypothetical protein